MVQENVGHITAEETHDHYIVSYIKNEQIPMTEFPVKKTTAFFIGSIPLCC
jgi:hypothetical protein